VPNVPKGVDPKDVVQKGAQGVTGALPGGGQGRSSSNGSDRQVLDYLLGP
jgi:hypothetical protein